VLDSVRVCLQTIHMPTAPLRRTKLADELVAEIARARVSKRSVARAAGISVDTLRRRLNNGRDVSFPTEDVVAICDFLGISYADLIERAREVDQVA